MAILKVKRLTTVTVPDNGTAGAVGLDLYMPEDVVVPAGARGQIVKLGLAVELPSGFHVELLPRSSTGVKTPIRISNEMGIIDSDYRGEIGAIVDNVSNQAFVLKKNERYFQMIVQKNYCDGVLVVDELSDTERSTGGYGSTGK